MRKKSETEKALTGTTRPDRVKKLAPVVTSKKAKPGEMTEAEREVYDHLIEHLTAAGTLNAVDVYSVELAAKIIELAKRAALEVNGKPLIQEFKTGAKQVAPEISVFEKTFAMFQKASTMLGLDPKARSLIGVEPTKADEGDPIRELLKKHG